RRTPRAAPIRNLQASRPGRPVVSLEDYTRVIRAASPPVLLAVGAPRRARAEPTARTGSRPVRLLRMGRALVLNVSDSPLAVVAARRAVVLVLKEKAEVVV